MNKTIKGFKPQITLGAGDLVPFWKDSTNETSHITYNLFISSILSTIVVQSAGSATNKVMSQKAVTDQLLAMDVDISALEASVPKKVTNVIVIALLENDDHWSGNKYKNDSPALTGQKEGDWYTNDTHKFEFRTATQAIRIPYAQL